MTLFRKPAAILCLGLVALGLAFVAAAPTATAAPKEVVEFNYPEWVYYDLIYLADDLGYFKEAGVKPHYTGQIAAGQMIPSLVAGSLDVINRHTPLVIAAVAGGADIKVFASGSQSTK
ncbi:MAG: ABC transporter substrate-binding protein, partial [Candidatus Adiutrix sp.]|nr:ABC transporter substrate-binding protein [Candidatus Adiutrix sp.]